MNLRLSCFFCMYAACAACAPRTDLRQSVQAFINVGIAPSFTNLFNGLLQLPSRASLHYISNNQRGIQTVTADTRLVCYTLCAYEPNNIFHRFIKEYQLSVVAISRERWWATHSQVQLILGVSQATSKLYENVL